MHRRSGSLATISTKNNQKPLRGKTVRVNDLRASLVVPVKVASKLGDSASLPLLINRKLISESRIQRSQRPDVNGSDVSCVHALAAVFSSGPGCR